MKTLFYDNPRALILIIVLILVGGLAAILTMPQEEDPKITNRVATILTALPGASAERVERLVTSRIEDELREIPEIDTIQSTSRAGLSSVTVVLQDRITETEGPFSVIRDAVNDAATNLPAEASDPEFIDDRGYAYTVLVALLWEADSAPSPLILKRTAEELQSRLRNVPGTEYVALHGASEEEISVTVSADLAQSLGLTEASIAAAIGQADAKGAAGEFFGTVAEYTLEVEGELNTLDRIRSIPLQIDAQGSTVQVADIARVDRGVTTPAEEFAIIDGKNAIVVGTRMETGLRVGGWTDQVLEELADFEQALSLGIEQRVIFNQADYASDRFGSLIVNLMVGLGLVVVILFFTLGVRAAILVSIVIPLTTVTALLVMNTVGITLHQMSVTGLIVALGLLVDAAIVVSDAVTRRLRTGMSAREAVAASVERLWIPLLSSTLTTVLAFLPISILPGGAGEFVGDISNSVIITLLCSYLLAMTVVAALAGYWFSRGGGQKPSAGLSVPFVGDGFRSLLGLSLRVPRLSVMAALILPVLGFIGVTTLPSQFFPEADRNQFHVQIRLSEQSSLAATLAAAETLDQLLEADPRITSADWFVGNSVPAFYYNLKMNQDGATNFAEAMVTAESLAGLDELQNDLQRTLSAALPAGQVLVRSLNQGPPIDAPVELRLLGPDLDTLKALGEEVRGILAEIPEVTVTTASIAGGVPKLWLTADEEAALRAGLRLTAVSDNLAATLQGARGGTVIEGDAELPVVVRLDDQGRRSISEISSLSISSAPGQATPLESLGELDLRPTPAAITRYQAERANIIYAYVKSDALPATALEAFQALADERGFEVPPGYRLQIGGDAEARSDAVGNLLSSVGLIVVTMIAVVVLTFNSFRLSIIVFSVAGLSMGLGLLCLTLFGYPFGFVPIIALMGLMGVAINAAIIILSGIDRNPTAAAGDLNAIRDEVMETSRHITSTTLTTFAGFIPLMLSTGGFWPPFAISIAGGVLLSTVLSFFFVPQMFILLKTPRGVESVDDGDLLSVQGVSHA